MLDNSGYVVDKSHNIYYFMTKGDASYIEFLEITSFKDFVKLFPSAKSKSGSGIRISFGNRDTDLNKFRMISQNNYSILSQDGVVAFKNGSLSVNGRKINLGSGDTIFDVSQIKLISSKDNCILITANGGQLYGLGSNSYNRLGIPQNLDNHDKLLDLEINNVVHAKVYETFSIIITSDEPGVFNIYTSGSSMFAKTKKFEKVLTIDSNIVD